MLITTLVVFVNLFITVFNLLIFLRVIGSYFMGPDHRLMAWLITITEPLLGPIRQMLPQFGGLDLSPIVTFFLLQGVGYVVQKLFGG